MHQADLDPQTLAHFGFTGSWVDAGVLTPSVLGALSARWAEGIDPHLEHYRWWAFCQYMQENPTLTAAQFDCLWELGCFDADQTMGCAMLFALVGRHDCPRALLERATASDHGALARKSRQVLVLRPDHT